MFIFVYIHNIISSHSSVYCYILLQYKKMHEKRKLQPNSLVLFQFKYFNTITVAVLFIHLQQLQVATSF